MHHKKEWFFTRRNRLLVLFAILFVFSLLMAVICYRNRRNDKRRLEAQQETLQAMKEVSETESVTDSVSSDEAVYTGPEILPEYQDLYEKNQDLIGWLSIEGTNIDYPVMQTMEDETYYLNRGFDKNENRNGCLIMDTDSNVGVGDREHAYQNGTEPSSNLIIHGHTMKSGDMFGNLNLYADETYGAGHSVICFDSLYEHRRYELIAVFYSQVYYADQDVFKYYKFFQADTQAEFDDWYENIKAMSLYDTGVTAQFGDEFITLSCCSYHLEDGRFVVVGKRIGISDTEETFRETGR
ncbi:MAG: class B sortase [Lachnospiraceae bacterium]